MADAVIAVSLEARNDILKLFMVEPSRVHVIHNGIDSEEYRPTRAPEKIKQFGIDLDKPYVLFVGRLTRQNGIIHLVNALKLMDKDFQVVLCAGAPDTREIGQEMRQHITRVQKEREGVFWVPEMLSTRKKIAFYSQAALFCCPSIYEPFGIINLEAMACETPVVASAVDGCVEAVVHGGTGLLVPPGDRESLVAAVHALIMDGELRRRMGRMGRQRVLQAFKPEAIWEELFDHYLEMMKVRASADLAGRKRTVH
jgi:glycosyltransferase involved in cell wall biosynthesis